MYKPLFTNIVMVPQKKEKAVAFLKNPKNILKWDSDIALAEEQSEGLKISRLHQSLNDHEVITVESFDDKVVYSSKGDRLDYQVVFELVEDSGLLEVSETLLVPEKTNSHLPLKLLKPIAKHAFANKLESLSMVIEQL